MDSKQKCETCKHFEAKALGDMIPLCHNEELKQDGGGFADHRSSFIPPTYDGKNFGCALWEGVSIDG